MQTCKPTLLPTSETAATVLLVVRVVRWSQDLFPTLSMPTEQRRVDLGFCTEVPKKCTRTARTRTHPLIWLVCGVCVYVWGRLVFCRLGAPKNTPGTYRNKPTEMTVEDCRRNGTQWDTESGMGTGKCRPANLPGLKPKNGTTRGMGMLNFFAVWDYPHRHSDARCFAKIHLYSLPFADCLLVTGVCARRGCLLCLITNKKYTALAFENHRTQPPPPPRPPRKKN